jgi:NAD(P)H dehydrogenase (quinone)
MSIVITGATGQLGRLVVKQLMAGGTPPDKIVATGRDIAKVTALSGDGLTARRADFAEPENSDGRRRFVVLDGREHHRTESGLG